MGKATAPKAARPKTPETATPAGKPAAPHVTGVFEGFEARIVGKPRTECPYNATSIEGESWLAAWDRADRAFLNRPEVLGPWHVHVYELGRMTEVDVQARSAGDAKHQALQAIGPDSKWVPADATRIAMTFGPDGQRFAQAYLEGASGNPAAAPG